MPRHFATPRHSLDRSGMNAKNLGGFLASDRMLDYRPLGLLLQVRRAIRHYLMRLLWRLIYCKARAMLPQERRWVLAHTELGCAGLHKTFG